MLDCARIGLPWAVAFGMLGLTAGPVIAGVEEKPLVRQSALRFQHRIVDEQPPRNPWMKLAGDFNDDGKLDIAIGGQSGSLVWYINPGWQKVHVAERGWKTVGDAVGDLNGDGFVDVVLAPAELQGRHYRLVWYEAPSQATRSNWQEHVVAAPVEAVMHGLAVDGNSVTPLMICAVWARPTCDSTIPSI